LTIVTLLYILNYSNPKLVVNWYLEIRFQLPDECRKTVRIYLTGVPALAGGMPAGTATYCRKSLIRLKPGLRSGGCPD